MIAALIVAGTLSTFQVDAQTNATHVSGTGSNTCTAGAAAGTDNVFVGCNAGDAIAAGGVSNVGWVQVLSAFYLPEITIQQLDS